MTSQVEQEKRAVQLSQAAIRLTGNSDFAFICQYLSEELVDKREQMDGLEGPALYRMSGSAMELKRVLTLFADAPSVLARIAKVTSDRVLQQRANMAGANRGPL